MVLQSGSWLVFSYIQHMWGLALAGDKQGVLFFVCVYAFLVLGYSLVRQFHAAGWPMTRGTLQSAGLEKFGSTEWSLSDQDYKVDALYAYEVNGETYTGKRVSPWLIVASHNARFLLERQLSKITRYDDGRVAVFYNPKRPEKSFLIKPSPLGQAFTAAFTFGPLLLYWFGYHY